MNLYRFHRLFWRATYELIARRLPGHNFGGLISRWSSNFRVFCARRFILACGTNIFLGPNVTLSFSSEIGSHVEINENCYMQGCKIGDYALIGPWCYSIIRHHKYKDPNIPVILQGYTSNNPPLIGRDVWIGARVMLLPGIKLGEGSVIAAGAIVTHDVAPFAVVAGIPAREIGRRALSSDDNNYPDC